MLGRSSGRIALCGSRSRGSLLAFSPRRALSLAAFLVLIVPAAALGTSITIVGLDGAAGLDGASGSEPTPGGDGAPGGSGGDGGAAGADAESIAAGYALATADAYGGAGGAGGSAGAPGPGGEPGLAGPGGYGGDAAASALARSESDRAHAQTRAVGGVVTGAGGVGGAASADAEATTTGPDSTDWAFAESNATSPGGIFVIPGAPMRSVPDAVATSRATAATGGAFADSRANAGPRAAPGFPSDGVAGGNATAVGLAVSGGSGQASTRVFSTAGAGGGAYGVGHRGGEPGIATGVARGISDSGRVSVELELRAGAGGRGEGGADASDGADAEAIDAASGATRGEASIFQSAIAGAGGIADGNAVVGNGGDGGSAVSLLRPADPALGRVSLVSSASGGAGGRGQQGGDGGDAHASARGVGPTVVITATAKAGGGGGSLSGPGGAPGEATLGEVFGESTTGGGVSATGEIYAGDGGGSADGVGADGGSAVVIDAVDGSASSWVVLLQRATGGRGAVGITGSGRGGDATSVLDRARDAEVLAVGVLAQGGIAALANGASAPAGGDGMATARGRNESGTLQVIARGEGGAGGAGAVGGRGGDAQASAEGATAGDGNRVWVGEAALTPFSRGRGAHGGAGGKGDVAGDGGDATSRSTGIADANSAVTVRDLARGGPGGIGTSSIGAGGDGGLARSAASGSNSGSELVDVSAEAFGGQGGTGASPGQGGGAQARAEGHSSGGAPVRARAFQVGGSGGFGAGSAPGGAGAAISVIDAVSGSTSGTLTLIQESVGGSGGTISPGWIGAIDRGGDGGSAQSQLRAGNPRSGDIVASTFATGGAGGAARGADGVAGLGGDASAGGFVEGMGHVALDARATGGAGGFGSEGAHGARGGVATLGEIFARSLGGGTVEVSGTVTAGVSHGSERGIDAVLEDAVDGETAGALILEQSARGGDGGRDGAGDAVSRLSRSRSAESLVVSSTARGGLVFVGTTPYGVEPRGGRAEALGDATNDLGLASALVRAEGGAGGGAKRGGASAGAGGDASVVARALSLGDAHDVLVGSTRSTDSGAFGGAGGADPDALVSPPPGFVEDARGGDARSESIGVADGSSAVTVIDRAVGGAGGGRAGAGGDASSLATGRNAGAREVQITADATGGGGGGGGGVGGAAVARARGESTTGAVSVTAIQRAGDSAGSSPLAADGLSTEMYDAVSGSTAGRLTLHQVASAGRGGGSHSVSASIGDGTGRVGDGGSALASLDATNPGSGALDVLVEVNGGAGGAGSTWSDGNLHGGDGGAAELDAVRAASLADASAAAIARGGNGGAVGGSGASVELRNRVDGESPGHLTLSQTAIAGAAGSPSRDGSLRGEAGDAISVLGRTRSAERLTLRAESVGGRGAISGLASAAGGGGDAAVELRSHNPRGAAEAFGRAQGGSGGGGAGSGGPEPVAGSGGRAEMLAVATANRDGEAIVGDMLAATTGAFGGAGGLSDIRTPALPQELGRGGDAVSESQARAQRGRVIVVDRAAGGGGGDNVGGGVRSVQGGDGGDAQSSASGRNVSDAEVVVRAEASGGAGGRGAGANGGNGGEARASAEGFSKSGEVRVSAVQTGGAGASGFASTASDGAGSTLRDAVRGATKGRLTLEQLAVGGVGGATWGGSTLPATSGRGGDAQSHLDAWNPRGGALSILSEARGGAGGAGSTGGNAARGGDARASAQARDEADASLDVRALAVGGAGGLLTSGNSLALRAGDGGAATLGPVRGSSTSGAAVSVHGEAIGGAGGYVTGFAGGGAGGSASAEDAVGGSTAGSLALAQIARGGRGGDGFGTGTGGSATSRLHHSGEASALDVTIEAIGGVGGSLAAGGSAELVADVENAGGALALVATSRGGTGGPAYASEWGGSAGDAALVARGATRGDGEDLEISATSIGGRGGEPTGYYSEGARSGDGGSASGEVIGVAEGDAAVRVASVVNGGEAGFLQRIGVGTRGDGGDASSIARASGAGASPVEATAQARAGNGAQLRSGSSGDASALAQAVGLGSARADALASAYGVGTDANVRAFADGGASALATAWASGASGAASAGARAHGTLVAARAETQRPIRPPTGCVGGPCFSGGSSVSARVEVDGPTGPLGNPFGTALSIVSASLEPADRDGALRTALGFDASDPLLAVVGLGGVATPDSLSLATRAEVEIELDALLAASFDSLALSFFEPYADARSLHPGTAATALSQLRFELRFGSSVLLDLLFDGASAALAYFDDRSLLLSELGELDPEATSLLVGLELVGVGGAFSLNAALLVDVPGPPGAGQTSAAPVPEPSTATLLGVGLLALLLTRRRGGEAPGRRSPSRSPAPGASCCFRRCS